MSVDLAGLPWWAMIAILLVGGAIGIVLSGALWAVLLTLMFGRWWRALLSVTLIGVGVWFGVHRTVWEAVDTGWGVNAWITAATVVTVIGIPTGLFLLRSRSYQPGAAGSSGSGSSGPQGNGTHFADYGSESNQWARWLQRREE